MKKSTVDLLKTLMDGGDANTGMPVFGFVHEPSGVFIHEPFQSSCGRFEINPETEYGISQEAAREIQALNKLIADAAEAAINAACYEVQTKLGIDSGDVAAQVFSDDGYRIAMAGAMRSYIRTEAWMAGEGQQDADGAKATLEMLRNHRLDER